MREPTPGGPWICTFTGVAFFPLDPSADEVRIEDVAHALSNKCRFNGMVTRFYSVAEHSVRVANLLVSSGAARDTVLAGLLHDGSEAYLPDVPGPVKLSPVFRDVWGPIEERVQVAVNRAFGLSQPHIAHLHPSIKVADRQMLATEKRDLMNAAKYEWAGLPEPLDDTIVPWSPTVAEVRFLSLFRDLQS
jgi:hypothetical protein